MLKYNDICKNIDEKYHEMIKQVNIIEFTKCIAQFSGLQLDEVSDDAICTYLTTWAKNKYRFFELLDKKLVKDTKISYIDESRDKSALLKELQTEFPIFAAWIEGFIDTRINKIETYIFNNWRFVNLINRIFPNCNIDGCTLTRFFKHYLKAPDELVTKLGRIFENEKVEAIYTISIDPVDMMLASENPYDWVSCYKLDGDHADGCLAAVLDNSSLITYLWNKEGKFKLKEKYDFKNIRYKRMREWISVNPEQTAIYFNEVYPGKNYSKNFYKILREVCENWLVKDGIWVKIGSENNDPDASEIVEREYAYGYNEFCYDTAYKIKGTKVNYWSVYNEEIVCPCGCGQYLPGSDNEELDEEEYNGEGFTVENYYQRHYCEYIDDYCDFEDCSDCEVKDREYAVCELKKQIQILKEESKEED